MEHGIDTYMNIIRLLGDMVAMQNYYNSILHQYNGITLYPPEMHVLQIIGENESITVTQIAQKIYKSISFCSQTLKKLMDKELLEQRRNPENKREYNLYLTEKGRKLFLYHNEYDRSSHEKCFEELSPDAKKDLHKCQEVLTEFNRVFKNILPIFPPKRNKV